MLILQQFKGAASSLNRPVTKCPYSLLVNNYVVSIFMKPLKAIAKIF